MLGSARRFLLLAAVLVVCVSCTGAPSTRVGPTSPASTTSTAGPAAALPFGDPAATLLPAADRAALQLVLDTAVAVFKRDPNSSAGTRGITATIITPRGHWSGAAGTGGDGTPLRAEAMMNIASITKTFTAAERACCSWCRSLSELKVAQL